MYFKTNLQRIYRHTNRYIKLLKDYNNIINYNYYITLLYPYIHLIIRYPGFMFINASFYLSVFLSRLETKTLKEMLPLTVSFMVCFKSVCSNV